MNFDNYVEQLHDTPDLSKRFSIYKSIEVQEKLMKKANETVLISEWNALSLCKRVVADFNIDDATYIPCLLSSIGISLSNELVQSHLKDETVTALLKLLLQVLANTKSNMVIQKVLHVLANQHFNSNIMGLFIQSLLTSIPITGTSTDSIFISVINKFLLQCPEEMKNHTDSWVKVLLKFSAHNNVITRQLATTTIKANIKLILSRKKQLLLVCVNCLKADVLPNLNNLCHKKDILQEILSAQLPVYMLIMGEDFKKSTSLSNSMLKFIEKGFCHAKEEVILSAFKAWGCLIESFAKNKDILASSKYSRLLIQPLKLKPKSESNAKALIETMWKLAVCLDDSLPDLFEMLCVPLFEICFGGATNVMQPRRTSGRLSMSKQLCPYENIQVLGAEMLARFLLPTSQDCKHDFYLDPLHTPLFASPSIFARFYHTLLPILCDTICFLYKQLSVEFLSGVWTAVLACVEDNVVRKRDTDMFRSLFRTAQRIINVQLPSNFLLMIVSSLASFPSKILNSSLHYSSAFTAGAMHGTPIISVLDFLLSPNVSKENLDNPKFLSCAQSVIKCGMERKIATLEFVRSVVKRLPKNHVLYLKIWICLSDLAVAYVTRTGNVNEGDSFEHDFSSLYDTLTFPFDVIINVKVDADVSENARISWGELFEQFTLYTTKIPTTEVNEARHHIATKLMFKLQTINSCVEFCQNNLGSHFITFLESVLLDIVKGAHLGVVEGRSLKKGSRQKYSKKLENIEAQSNSDLSPFLTTVVELLHIATDSRYSEEKSTKMYEIDDVNVMPCVQYLFSNSPLSLIQPLFFNLLQIITPLLNNAENMSARLKAEVEQTWTEVLLRLTYKTSMFQDADVCEIFEVAFLRSTSAVYQTTVDFWQLKVMDCNNVTELPEHLLIILRDVYEQEGFPITWEDDNNANFNVSTISTQSNISMQCDKETSLNETVVSESDISGESTASDRVSHSNEDEDDDDVTQLDVSKTDDYVASESKESFEESIDFDEEPTKQSEDSAKSTAKVPLANNSFIADRCDGQSNLSMLENCVNVTKRKSKTKSKTDRKRAKMTQRFSARLRNMKGNEKVSASINIKAAARTVDVLPVVVNTNNGQNNLDEKSYVDNLHGTNVQSPTENEVIEEDWISDDNDESCVIVSDSEYDSSAVSEVMIIDSEEESYVSASDKSISNLPTSTNESENSQETESDASTAELKPTENSHAIYVVDSPEEKSNNLESVDEEDDQTFVSSSDASLNQDGDILSNVENCDKSLYEVVEMKEISVCNSGMENQCEKKDTDNTCDVGLREEESAYELVEMAEISINPDTTESSKYKAVDSGGIVSDTEEEDQQVNPTQLPVDPDKITSSNTHEEEGTTSDTDVERSVYELVEMAEMSVNADKTVLVEDKDPNELTQTSINVEVEVDSSTTEDTSLYEVVEMAEMSVCLPENLNKSNHDNGSFNLSESNDLGNGHAVGEVDNKSEISDTCVFSDVLNTSSPIVSNSGKNSTICDRPQECDNSDDINNKCNIEHDKFPVSQSNICGSKIQTCFSTECKPQSVYEECRSDPACTISSLDPFTDCARDLGVQPLDSSFESTEPESNKPEISPENKNNDSTNAVSDASGDVEVLLSSQREVYENSLPDGVKNELNMNPVVQLSKADDCAVKSMTPLRRSARKRITTPKMLVEIAERKLNGLTSIEQLKKAMETEEDDGRKKSFNIKDSYNEQNNEEELMVLNGNESPVKEITNISSDPKRLPKYDNNNASEQTTDAKKLNSREPENNEKDREVILSANNVTESPQITIAEKTDEANLTPKSCLGKRLSLIREESVSSPNTSPSGQGILKKRVADDPSPVTKSRRVSFAEPISTSAICDDIDVTPVSSPRDWRKHKLPNRIVSRRLSLPPSKRASTSRDSEVPSPMSVRSANIAAAIADIKARNGDSPVGCNSSASIPAKSAILVESVTVSQLQSTSFLKSLTVQQLTTLTETVLQAVPALHSTLMVKMRKT